MWPPQKPPIIYSFVGLRAPPRVFRPVLPLLARRLWGFFQPASEIPTCDWSIERSWCTVVAPETFNVPMDILILAPAWARFFLLEESFQGSRRDCNSCCINKAKLNRVTVIYTETWHV